MIPLPRLTFESAFSYISLAAGLAIGFALFKPPMDTLENAFRKKA